MKKSTTLILIGVGVLALVGVGIFVMRGRRKDASGAGAAEPSSGNVVADVGSKITEALKKSPEAVALREETKATKAEARRETQKQRLENKRLRRGTRQAKLIKKGKIDPRDLQTLQSIQAFSGGEFFD